MPLPPFTRFKRPIKGPKNSAKLSAEIKQLGARKLEYKKVNSFNLLPHSRKSDPGNCSEISIAQKIAACSDATAREALPIEDALRLGILPLKKQTRRGNTVISICSSKDESKILTAAEFALSAKVRSLKIEEQLLKKAILIAYHSNARDVEEALKKIPHQLKNPRLQSQVSPQAENSEVPQVLESLLAHAVANNASDIHFCPTECGTTVSARIAGELHRSEENIGNNQFHRELIASLRVRAGLPFQSEQKPADGAFEHYIAGCKYRFRLGLVPTLYGVKACVRVIQTDNFRSLHQLGFPTELTLELKQFITELKGLTVFCGRAGSGKSTSAAAVLSEASREGKHCYSLEDPIERELPGVSQIEVSAKLSFEDAFAATLRADPEVIAVGEIRSPEAANVCIQAALSGHLIVCTMHAGSCASALARLESLSARTSKIALPETLLIHQTLRTAGDTLDQKLTVHWREYRGSRPQYPC